MRKLNLFNLLLLVLLYGNTIAQIQGDWKLIGPTAFPTNISGQVNGMGRVSQIKFHPTNPNKLYAVAATGGLWISEDNASSWQKTGTDNLPVHSFASVCVDYTNDSIIYLGGGDANYYSRSMYAIWKSTDGGQTWNPSNMGIGNKLVVELLMSPIDHNTLIAATDLGIYKTTDGGATWASTLSSGDFTDMVFKPVSNSATIYAVSHSQIFRSTDMGDTWSQLTNGDTIPNNNGEGMRIAVTPADTNRVYVAMIANRGNVLRSNDGGDSWTTIKNDYGTSIVGYAVDQDGQGNYDFTLIAHPQHADWLFLSAECHWRSLDGGYTWEKLTEWWWNCHTDMHDYAFNPANPNQLFNANDGGVWMSEDTARNWTPKSDFLSNTEFYHAGNSNLQRGYIDGGTQDNGEIYMNNGHWLTNGGGDWGSAMSFDYLSSGYCYEYQNGTRRGLTGGASNLNIPVTAGVMEFTPDEPNVSFVGEKEVYRTSNLASTQPDWTKISNINATINDVKTVPGNPNILYAVTGTRKLYRTDNALDANPTWTSYNLTNNTNLSAKIATVSRDSNVVYVIENNRVYRSINKGVSFNNVTHNLPNTTIQQIISDKYSNDESVYVLTNNTVYYKNAAMNSWLNYSYGLPTIANVNELMMFNNGTSNAVLRIAYYGRGLWETSLYASPICSPTNSLFATNIAMTSAVLHWNANGSGGYVLQYKNLDSLGWNEVSTNTNSYSLAGLLPDTKYAFRVKCICSSSDTSGFSLPATFTTVCEPVPVVWSHEDIGSVAVPGDVCYHPQTQTFDVKGSGNDIWDYYDECHFMYKRIVGDGQITALCESIDAVYPWAKSGPMIRQSLDSNSAQAIMSITPENGAAFQWRPDNTTYTYNTNDTSFHAPVWLKLARTGNVVTGYASNDSVNWTEVEHATINLSDTVYIGVAHSSHINSLLSQSVFRFINISPDSAVVNVATGITVKSDDKMSLNIFPNPAGNNLHIALSLPALGNTTISVLNLLGATVMQEKRDTEAGQHMFTENLSSLSSGIYFLRVSSGLQNLTRRFVVSK